MPPPEAQTSQYALLKNNDAAPSEGHDQNPAHPPEQLSEPVLGPDHHAVPGHSGIEIRTTTAAPTPQSESTTMATTPALSPRNEPQVTEQTQEVPIIDQPQATSEFNGKAWPEDETKVSSPTNSASSRHSTDSITSIHPEQDPEEALARNQNPVAQVQSKIIPILPNMPKAKVEDNTPYDGKLPENDVTPTTEEAPAPPHEVRSIIGILEAGKEKNEIVFKVSGTGVQRVKRNDVERIPSRSDLQYRLINGAPFPFLGLSFITEYVNPGNPVSPIKYSQGFLVGPLNSNVLFHLLGVSNPSLKFKKLLI